MSARPTATIREWPALSLAGSWPHRSQSADFATIGRPKSHPDPVPQSADFAPIGLPTRAPYHSLPQTSIFDGKNARYLVQTAMRTTSWLRE